MNTRFISEKWMQRLIIVALCLQCSMLHAQTGTWRSYMSYYEPQQIVKCDHELFIRASNDLYSYNLNDQSITTYDKINRLNDTYITMIGLNRDTRKLLIVYQNQNMDVLDCQSGEVENISALYLKSMTVEKNVNSIYMSNQYAYLATGFGIMKINMKKDEVSESYILNKNIQYVAISGNNIYAQVKEADAQPYVITASLNANLLDPNKWTVTTDVPNGLFDQDLTDWNQYHELVSTLKPGGPKYNNFAFMRFKHNRLYTCGGGFTAAMDMQYPGIAQILCNDEWTILPDNLQEVTGWKYIDAEAIDADPFDPNHVFVGARSGLYEFQDGQFSKAHNMNNSLLQSVLSIQKPHYTLVFGIAFDPAGNLWCVNSMAGEQSIVALNKNGEWESHHQKELIFNNISLESMRNMIIDSRGYLWFVNEHWNVPSIYCYDPSSKRLLNAFTTLTNQDGTTISDYNPHCIAEDLNGNIWVGTNKGPFLIEKNIIGTENPTVTQVKVPRNDGTDFADYLLAGANVRSIVVDGGGRKWFATEGNGIYLISEDNMNELEHFTVENSFILSNTVYSLAINNDTGELFIGTDMGLCSYMSDATTAVSEMKKDDIYAFPNPVVAGYNGLITIRGFSIDADVKILTADGKLVVQGRSNGGTFTWNCRDRQGRRVATGVYMVAAATHDGKKGTVCKIAVIN